MNASQFHCACRCCWHAPSAAMAAAVSLQDAGAETGAGNETTGWGQNAWGLNTPAFTRPSTEAHSGTYSLKVEMTGYTSGDAKWPVTVTGGKYYKFTDWHKSDVDTAVSMCWQTAAQIGTDSGTWSNLETGIEPSSSWKQLEAERWISQDKTVNVTRQPSRAGAQLPPRPCPPARSSARSSTRSTRQPSSTAERSAVRLPVPQREGYVSRPGASRLTRMLSWSASVTESCSEGNGASWPPLPPHKRR